MRLTIQAGDVEIDLEGAAIQIDEQITHAKSEHTWTMLLERIREARESAMEAAVTAAREAGLPERGSAFRALLENCALTRKPDQVLGAIHYLRNVEGISDSLSPRVVNELFADAGIDPPGETLFVPESPEGAKLPQGPQRKGRQEPIRNPTRRPSTPRQALQRLR